MVVCADSKSTSIYNECGFDETLARFNIDINEACMEYEMSTILNENRYFIENNEEICYVNEAGSTDEDKKDNEKFKQLVAKINYYVSEFFTKLHDWVNERINYIVSSLSKIGINKKKFDEAVNALNGGSINVSHKIYVNFDKFMLDVENGSLFNTINKRIGLFKIFVDASDYEKAVLDEYTEKDDMVTVYAKNGFDKVSEVIFNGKSYLDKIYKARDAVKKECKDHVKEKTDNTDSKIRRAENTSKIVSIITRSTGKVYRMYLGNCLQAVKALFKDPDVKKAMSTKKDNNREQPKVKVAPATA